MRSSRVLPAFAVVLALTAGTSGRAQLAPEQIAAWNDQAAERGWTFRVAASEATGYALAQLCGTAVPAGWDKGVRFDPGQPENVLPAAFDWRALGGCTPVRNQLGCGACWAFATVGPLECNILISEGTATNLSEQWLVSCNREDWDCIGGWWAHDYHMWQTDACGGTGAVLESVLPYTASEGECNCPYPHAYRLSGWAYIGGAEPDIGALKQAILDHGPITVGVHVNEPFQAYSEGIFNACWNGEINHGVVLVGWDDDGQYWILRNWWGASWGEGGYMRIQYDCSRIGAYACYADYQPHVIKGTIRRSDGAPLGGVALSGYPCAVTTSVGTYCARVGDGWSGTLTPTKVGYTFTPASRTFASVSGAQLDQDFTAEPVPFTISGHVREVSGAGVPGVTVYGLPGDPVTNEAGFYSAAVYVGWTGTATPTRQYATFSPTGRWYTNVSRDYAEEDYTATDVTYLIAGFVLDDAGVPVEGVRITGLPGDVRTFSNGGYFARVPLGWAGTARPVLMCYAFTPAERAYSDVRDDQRDENYQAQFQRVALAGWIRDGRGYGLGGVELLGLDGVSTDPNGYYATTLDCGWSGFVTPRKPLWFFEPESREYGSLTGGRAGEDFLAAPLHDCNGNGVPDEDDIAGGASEDDNANGVPDECELRAGDLDCNGGVDFNDIHPFAYALVGHEEYRVRYPACLWRNADCNGDGRVDFNDINPFVERLSQG
ncbi:MAG: C1 family peptidase [Planctomycetota bacterium]